MSNGASPHPDPAVDVQRVVLLIEDDEAVRRSLQMLLHWRGYDVRSFAGAAPVLEGHASSRHRASSNRPSIPLALAG